MPKLHQLREKRLSAKELSAEEAVLTDLFYDFYRHRGRIYRINFIRGLFFGLGVFLGGTMMVAIIVALLSWIMSLSPGPIHDFIEWIVNTLSRRLNV